MYNMNIIFSHHCKTLFFIISACCCTLFCKAQQKSDSLSFNQVITRVIDSHPSIKEAEETLHEANSKIELAKSAYLPTADLSGSYSRVGPVSKVTFPELGSFQFNPYDNYTIGVNVNQMIYDFGKTSKSVEIENKKKEINQTDIDRIKQNLSKIIVNNYYNLVYIQSAIGIKNEELENLQAHLHIIEKKNDTGSATKYELLTTQVKISTVESQKYDLEASYRVQQSILNTLLGLPEDTPHQVYTTFAPENFQDDSSLIDYAFTHREELRLAKEKTELEQLNYEVYKSFNNPTINAFGSAGFRNGYAPDLNELRGNFLLGIGIKVPLYDAKKRKNNMQLAKSGILMSQYETEIQRRNITNEVVEAKSYIDASKKKVDQFELQLSHAQQAYELAMVSYKSGTITNLDLLDSETAVSESHLQLLKAKIDQRICFLNLEIAMGQHLY